MLLLPTTMENKVDFEEETARREAVNDQQGSSVPDPKPSDRLRAAFASALITLKADKVAYSEREKDIAVAINILNAQKEAYKERKKQVAESLKSNIREILRDEIAKRKQSTSVMAAVSALTSLGDSNQCPPQTDSSPSEADLKLSEVDARTQSSSPREAINMSFPHKLMEVLNDKANESIITWLPHGKAFVIYQKEKFASDILPRYFKETKYTSFTRKLNRWGFERIKKGPEIGAYYHKFFQKENLQLCTKMTCVSSKTRIFNSENASPPPSLLGGVKTPEAASGSHTVMNDSQHSSSSNRMMQQLQMLHLQRNAVAPPSDDTLRSSFFGQPMPQVLSSNQIDYLSQQVQLMNLQRVRRSPDAEAINHFPTQNQMMSNAINSGGVVAPNNLGSYSSAVISAAVEALQRSFQMPQSYQAMPSCSVVYKPVVASPAVLQQHIEQYGRSGVMHPELYALLLQQQAAAAAMFRLQQQQQPRNEDGRQPKSFSVKRAHAA